jgi:hypothetical protein
MDRIDPIIKDASHNPPTRLAIVSGHDDTISPLMASLGIWNDTMWPAYASMFLIEVSSPVHYFGVPFVRVASACLFCSHHDAIRATFLPG